MTTTTRPHVDVVAAALEDWWLTTDPAQPFECRSVAEAVDDHLRSSGYRIAPDTEATPMTTPRTTCDASHVYGRGPSAAVFGPCILRHGHDGPLHRDAHGRTWWAAPGAPVPPSRAAVACTAFLALACLTAGAAAALRRDWAWVCVAVLGAALLLLEVRDEVAARRAARRQRP